MRLFSPLPATRAFLLASPALIYVLLFLLIPFAGLIAVSFARFDGLFVVWDFTAENYQRIFSEKSIMNTQISVFGLVFPADFPVYIVLILKSIIMSMIVTSACLLIGFPIALYLSTVPDNRKSIYLFLITLPFWTSYLLRTFAWKFILGQSGLVNKTLVDGGIIDGPLEFLIYSPTAVAITLVHTWVVLAVIPIFLSVDKIDRSLYDASADLGDGPWRAFGRVTLPLALPGIRSAAMLVFIPTAGDFVAPALVGGTSGSLVGNAVLSFFKAANYPPMGAALVMTSLCAVLMVGALLSALLRLSRTAR